MMSKCQLLCFRIVQCLILFITTLMLQGCLTILSIADWNENSTSKVYLHQIEAVSCPTSSQATPTYMIVTYGSKRLPFLYWDYCYNFAIPLNKNNSPELFGYDGKARTLSGIIKDIPEEQIGKIENYRFSRKEASLGKKLLAKSHGGAGSKQVKNIESVFGPGLKNYENTDIDICPYRWIASPQPRIINDDVWGADLKLDSRYSIILLPHILPSRKTDAVINTGMRVASMPILLLTDCILLPLEIHFVITYRGH